MDIEKAQRAVDDWIEKYGIRYFDEKTNMLILMEEVGELSRWMARSYGEQSFKAPVKENLVKESITDEMADIFFVLLCLCNQMDIDLSTAFVKNLDKKSRRDSGRHKENPRLK
nr:nucleotide pyrophosphohydrolase [Saprospiraceae bacterium]